MKFEQVHIICLVISALAVPTTGGRCTCKKEFATIESKVSKMDRKGKNLESSIEQLQILHDELANRINNSLQQGT